MKAGRVWVFGEVLFDHFPDGSRVLGGAPFNVAWHLQAFGLRPLLVSRVGDDAEGKAVLDAMRAWGMDTTGVQVDPALPTGRVGVRLVDGEPRYTIERPVAWDGIAPPPGLDTLDPPGLLYHGTLALRDAGSRDALERLRERRPRIVFVDVNLRPPFWDRDAVLAWLRASDWGKLNRGELEQLSARPGDPVTQARSLLDDCGLEGLIVTHGSGGAEVIARTGETARSSPGQPAPVVDTVGAGDAFSAVTIAGLASGWALDVTLNRAHAFAQAVCGLRGATVRDPALYRPFLQAWSPGPA